MDLLFTTSYANSFFTLLPQTLRSKLLEIKVQISEVQLCVMKIQVAGEVETLYRVRVLALQAANPALIHQPHMIPVSPGIILGHKARASPEHSNLCPFFLHQKQKRQNKK